MTDPAQYTSAFPRTTRISFLFAFIFAATITPYGFANAEQGLNVPFPKAACDLAKKQSCEELVQDNILWKIDDPDDSASKHWQQNNLDNLCECTTDPYATVNCFQIQVNNNRKSWQEAVATCRAQP